MSHSMIKRTATIAAAVVATATLVLPAEAAAAPAGAPAVSSAAAVGRGHVEQTAHVAPASAPLSETFQIPGYPLNGAKRLDGTALEVVGSETPTPAGIEFGTKISGTPGTFEGTATVYWLNLATFHAGQAPMTYSASQPGVYHAISDVQQVGAGPVIAAIATNGTLVPSAGHSTPYISTPTAGYFLAP